MGLLQEVMTREKEASAKVRALQAELSTERSEHEKEVEQRNHIITKLKEEVKQLRSTSLMEIKYASKEAKANSNCMIRIFKKEEVDQDAEKRRLQKQLEIEERVNRATEEFVKRRQGLLQDQIQDWSTKYERDTEEMDRKLDDLRMNRQRDLATLKDYEQEYQRVQEETLLKAKEAEDSRIRQQKETAEQNSREVSAIIIQAVWRRVLVKKSRKKKGGKTTKKGKGKGKGTDKGKKPKK
mmetsp:Transcript_6066/g.9323  ORF Transcript_6066/g.9323 Transcript_6066/m.9323 type:complete len:239 (+) Transcript_6066:114-830(+)